MLTSKEQLERICEGLVDILCEEDLIRKIEGALQKKKSLRIKYGADPSAPDLHLGHTVPLRKLRQFQELGHTVVFIIGDFTARIGDPTHKSETRKMLSEKEVMINAKSYQEQVFRILDKKKTEVRYNSEWLENLKPRDFLNLTSQYTVARLLERDDFSKRYAAQKPIAVIEFLYPLLQGYDSVVVKSDVELGGTDQKFNLLVGRELQKTWGQEPQVVLTMPLIEGTDGVQKMSKSLGNHIGIREIPSEMFGKIMSLPDSLLEKYCRYTAAYSKETADRIVAAYRSGALHPRSMKADLGERIVELFYGKAEAEKAREGFDKVFRDKGLPDQIPEILLPAASMDIVTLLKEASLVSSKGEARRLIEQGGVKLEQQKVSDPLLQVDLRPGVLVQCGKRRYAKVRYGQ